MKCLIYDNGQPTSTGRYTYQTHPPLRKSPPIQEDVCSAYEKQSPTHCPEGDCVGHCIGTEDYCHHGHVDTNMSQHPGPALRFEPGYVVRLQKEITDQVTDQ
jgi:hypothetical protein